MEEKNARFVYTFGVSTLEWLINISLVFFSILLAIYYFNQGNLEAFFMCLIFALFALLIDLRKFYKEHKIKEINNLETYRNRTDITFYDTYISFTTIKNAKFYSCDVPYTDILNSYKNLYTRYKPCYTITTTKTRSDYGGASSEKYFHFLRSSFDHGFYTSFIETLEEKTSLNIKKVKSPI